MNHHLMKELARLRRLHHHENLRKVFEQRERDRHVADEAERATWPEPLP